MQINRIRSMQGAGNRASRHSARVKQLLIGAQYA